MKIGKKAVTRLSRYKDALGTFKSYGIDRFYSWDLASALGLTAAQVRKDFSIFNVEGKKKVGYSVDSLTARIGEILGKNKIQTAVLCGTGLLGKTIVAEGLFSGAHVRLVAAFDDPGEKNVKNVFNLPVHPLDDLTGFVRDNKVTIGIIAAAGVHAQRFLDHLVLAGIRGVLSLANNDLKAPRACVVANVNLSRELENVMYFVNNQQKKAPK
jgi:redox-sensing transcriptional repressor